MGANSAFYRLQHLSCLGHVDDISGRIRGRALKIAEFRMQPLIVCSLGNLAADLIPPFLLIYNSSGVCINVKET